jgi:hypothetical protein
MLSPLLLADMQTYVVPCLFLVCPLCVCARTTVLTARARGALAYTVCGHAAAHPIRHDLFLFL